jgi:hypothetical protein
MADCAVKAIAPVPQKFDFIARAGESALAATSRARSFVAIVQAQQALPTGLPGCGASGPRIDERRSIL